MLTVNGRVKMVRRWWHSPTSGSVAPVDDAVDARHESVSPGVREMACRVNNDATNFDGAADNLHRTAQIRGVNKRQAADRLLNYMAERREMIRYPEFAARGWQIGSGPTESRCKTSTSRLKGRGRRWNGANAEAISSLTALKDSGQWNLYWPTPSQTTT